MPARPLICAAVAVACGLVAATASAHVDTSKGDRCHGIAKAGGNDCGNLTGTHDCAGQATTDLDPAEWKLVPRGTCRKLGGLSPKAARKQLGLKG
ncbi:MAG: DUF2282 domain-containing protein [Burkholderiales bacterium]|jgi:uncharacterized membrane protein|nr:DUF2282 domain-containing protein [Burkholderiales bacterium]